MKLGILCDIHEDINSLRIALDIFNKNKCDELICLGDIIGFESAFYPKVKFRSASECLNIIQNQFNHVVVGNHDLFAIKKIPVQLNGFIYPQNWYELTIDKRREYSKGKIWLYENESLTEPLNSDEIEYLGKLPESKIINYNGTSILISHSIYPDLTGSNFFRLFNPWELKSHFSYMEQNNISFGFSGHMHAKALMVATMNDIKEIPLKRTLKLSNQTQYLCPCIANGKGKSGLIIANISDLTIESFEINNSLNYKLFSLYGGSKEKNKP